MTHPFKKYKNAFVSMLLWIAVLSVHAQSAKIGQLEQDLQLASTDTAKINILNKLSWEYHRVDVQQTFDYALQAIQSSEKINYKKGLSRGHNLLAIAYSFQGNSDSALIANERGLALALEIQDSFLISVCNNDLGILYDEAGKPELALKAFQEALRFTTKRDVLAFFSLMNISFFYYQRENEEAGKKYLLEAIETAKQFTDTLALISTNESLGYHYMEQEKLDTALSYFLEVIDLAQKSGDKYSLAITLSKVGDIYAEKGLYEEAKNKHLHAIDLMGEMGNFQYLTWAYLSLSNSYKDNKEYKKAIQTAERGLRIAQKTKLELANKPYFELLADAYSNIGDFEKAFYFQKQLGVERDSLFKAEQQKAIAEIETKFQVEKQEKENALLKAQQAENEAQLRYQNLWIWGSLLIMFLGFALAGILFYLFVQKRNFSNQLEIEVKEKTASLVETNKALKASNDELERFTYIASHDLKEPIRNIVSFSSLLKREVPKENDNAGEYISFITKSAKQLYALISDVLEYSRVTKETAPLELVNVNEIVENIKETLTHASLNKKPVKIQYDSLPKIRTSGSHLHLIFKNLIENGVKYNQSSQANVEITHNENGHFHWFHIKDNGIGIEPEYHQKIFGMFTRLHTRIDYEGTGMGLAICKKIINRFNGQLQIESQPGKGSTFSFSIPK